MIYERYKLKDVCTIIAGQSPKSDYYNTDGEGVPFFQGKADFGNLYPTIRVYCSQPTKLAQKDDILLSVRAPVGATNLAPCTVCIGRGLTAIRPSERLLTKYVLAFFRYYEAELNSKGTGTTFKAITQDIIKNIEIPVPPIEEQKRIVTKIEELISSLDSGVETLKKTRELLKVYRQAVITEAFPEMNEENTKKLLDIADVSSGITKGRKLSGQSTITLPYLRVANVQNGYLDLSEMKKIELKESEKERFLLKYDDVLYTEGGDRDKLGRGTVWRNEIPDCVHQNHVFKARVNREIAIPQYVAMWSMATPARNYFYYKGKQSVNLASINKTVLVNLELPIPSLEEQQKTLDVIEEKLSVCDSIQKTIDNALIQAEAMRSSILKKAFEGKM